MKAILRILLAVALSSLSIVLLSVFGSMLFGVTFSENPKIGNTLGQLFLIFSVVFTVVFVIGLPIHFLLRFTGKTRCSYYLASGFVVPSMPFLVLFLTDADPRGASYGILGQAAIMGVYGAVAAYVVWKISVSYAQPNKPLERTEHE